MAKRQPVKPGQPITAKFLNTPQADDPAQGWGEQQASLTAQFKASEDFTTFEDLYRGNCKRYWRDRGSSAYAVNGADEYVYAWSAISSGEIFPAIYNRQSGRWEAISATAASGGASGGGGLATNNCCSTIYLAGSVDLDGLEWATDYTITLASPIGTVTVTDQGSGTWESDAVEVSCTVDEVTVTDEYTVTMTATGNAPGEVIVTVALTLGGGYGGAAGCCETTEAGFSWKYVNCCIVDPLAGWSMTRDPSGFSGQECEIGGCEICVTPKASTVTLCARQCYDPDVTWTSAFTSGCSGANVVNVYAIDASSNVNGFENWRIAPFTLSTVTAVDDCDSCWADKINFHTGQLNAGILASPILATNGGSINTDKIYEQFDNTVSCGNSTGSLFMALNICSKTDNAIAGSSSSGMGQLRFIFELTSGCYFDVTYAFFQPGDAGSIDLESLGQRTLTKVYELQRGLGNTSTNYWPNTLTITPAV